MKKREPLYEKYADIIVDEPSGWFSVDNILNEIKTTCKNKYKGIILPFKKIYQNEGYLKYPNKIYAELEKE